MKPTRLDDLIEDSKTAKGRWSLTSNHELQYKAKDLKEEIKFQGSLIAVEPDALVIAVTQRQEDQKTVTRIVKLEGAWRANAKNQLVFEVEKESGAKDILTFKGTWQIGKANEIIYTYEQTNLKSKRKETQELSFAGYWDIADKNRLTYWLSADSNSVFRFRTAFQTQSILAKKGEIRYQIGIEAKGKREIKTISLFGKWKLSRTLELTFEIETSGRKNVLTFGGEYHLDEDKQIAVNLKSQEGKPLGLELIFTKDFFGKDGQAFVRLAKSIEETRVEAGVNFRW